MTNKLFLNDSARDTSGISMWHYGYALPKIINVRLLPLFLVTLLVCVFYIYGWDIPDGFSFRVTTPTIQSVNILLLTVSLTHPYFESLPSSLHTRSGTGTLPFLTLLLCHFLLSIPLKTSYHLRFIIWYLSEHLVIRQGSNRICVSLR